MDREPLVGPAGSGPGRRGDGGGGIAWPGCRSRERARIIWAALWSVNALTDLEIYSVSRLNREVRGTLEARFPALWIEGELSNLARPASGHLYFSLKDEAAQVRCAMFRSRGGQLDFVPEAGMQVLAFARVSLFEPRGDFQLIVERLQPAGAGLLQIEFDRLKRKLAAEGLFDAARKRPIPRWPKQLGVITSPSGAALRDVLAVLRRRCPLLPVIVYPSSVQGERAAGELLAAIEIANARADCDVLLLTRGGGSIEDLWPFNDERLARAIAASAIPIVSGVGHEVDFTIADFVADLRAPTPSAAAELISPDLAQWREHAMALRQRLHAALRRRLERGGEMVDWYERRLRQPAWLIDQRRRHLAMAQQRLHYALSATAQRAAARLGAARNHLEAHHPRTTLADYRARCARLSLRLDHLMRGRLAIRQARLATLSRALHAVSPLATLERGYAIVRDPATRAITRDATTLRPGDRLEALLARGALDVTVIAVHPPEPEPDAR
ncbi:MAG: exodeoxyribonuclease VII large subunit [Gammaproteobacteria bacterium]|nr:exodeoxyribonuclease VII large subunit [Gammaproteobacteria bacterium]